MMVQRVFGQAAAWALAGVLGGSAWLIYGVLLLRYRHDPRLLLKIGGGVAALVALLIWAL